MFGGVGSGLYGMIVDVILAVFIAGLMVGRTPEYLGKKIEAYDVKMAMLSVLIFSLIILVFTAIAVVTPFGKAGITNPGPHGLSQILYAYTSGAIFFRARFPAIASTGMIMKNRPSNMSNPMLTLYQSEFQLPPANAEPLFAAPEV